MVSKSQIARFVFQSAPGGEPPENWAVLIRPRCYGWFQSAPGGEPPENAC